MLIQQRSYYAMDTASCQFGRGNLGDRNGRSPRNDSRCVWQMSNSRPHRQPQSWRGAVDARGVAAGAHCSSPCGVSWDMKLGRLEETDTRTAPKSAFTVSGAHAARSGSCRVFAIWRGASESGTAPDH